ncbi:MAG TPA: patatin-like phospholipase family protein [Mycobacteriales bacterium]|nr:patatin-like phospholipase family protein [Mycobacteriales bacterium]
MRVVGKADRPRVGLVLGAGGVLGGAWLAGGLAALTEATGWDPATADVIVGTSAGSMIGALLACGVPPWFMVAHSAGDSFPGLLDAQGQPTDEADRSAGGVLVRGKGMPDLRPLALAYGLRALRDPRRHRLGAVAAAFAPRGVMSTRPLRETVQRVAPTGWSAHPALWIVATDCATGRRVVFGRDDAPPADLSQAVAASCAVPGIYRPVRIGGRTYVDGGAWSPSNLDCVARAELDLVVCLNPLSAAPEELARAGRGAIRGRMRRATGRRLGWEARRLRERGTAVVLVQPTADDLAVMGGNMMSTTRRHLVLSTAQRTVAEQLAGTDLVRLLAEQPRADEHRLRRPAGPVEDWPPEALPPGTSVEGTRRGA